MTLPDSELKKETNPPISSAIPGQTILFSNQPVNWQEWSDRTFEQALRDNKPVLLSIAYSSCDWCQLMARQSFFDADIAGLLNESFVCIGVDRELRPDIDSVYQTLHVLLNDRPGGWPLTLFLCPRTRLPFFAGTFYARGPVGDGGLGFLQLLQKVRDFYLQQAQSCQRLLRQVEDNLLQVTAPIQFQPLADSAQIMNAVEGLDGLQDREQGGFGSQPKFTQPVNLLFLLRVHEHGELSSTQLLHLKHALQTISTRGINDLVGGGFFRYTTDAGWHMPSFEKMLYDNGMLLEVYARAWSSFQLPEFKKTASDLVRWLKRHMLAPEGAFYSAQDSGSDSAPGGYYRYFDHELEAALSDEEWMLFRELFGIGTNNGPEPVCLSQRVSLMEAAEQCNLSPQQSQELYDSGLARLELLRESRKSPRVEKTFLVSANALAVKGLAVMARYQPEVLSLAHGVIDFIVGEMWINQRLFASWRQGRLGAHAYLDDYAYLIDALLESLQTHWRDSDYRLAMTLAETLLHLHQDGVHGGFCYTAHDAELLVYRHKPFMDSIQPAANGVAARALLRLGYLSGEPRFLKAAEATLRSAALLINHSPDNHLSLVEAHAEYLKPLPRVLMMDDGDKLAWARQIESQFSDRVLCFCLPSDTQFCPADALGMEPGEAIVCNSDECSAAVTCLADLQSLVLEQLPQASFGVTAVGATK